MIKALFTSFKSYLNGDMIGADTHHFEQTLLTPDNVAVALADPAIEESITLKGFFHDPLDRLALDVNDNPVGQCKAARASHILERLWFQQPIPASETHYHAWRTEAYDITPQETGHPNAYWKSLLTTLLRTSFYARESTLLTNEAHALLEGIRDTRPDVFTDLEIRTLASMEDEYKDLSPAAQEKINRYKHEGHPDYKAAQEDNAKIVSFLQKDPTLFIKNIISRVQADQKTITPDPDSPRVILKKQPPSPS